MSIRYTTCAILLAVAAGAFGHVAVHASPKAPPETLDISILSPRDGIALNAAAIDIQALVSARRDGRSDDDVWSGWLRVNLAIDGVAAQSLDPTACRGQIAAGFRVNLVNLAPGSHTATVIASKKTRGNTVHGSASLAFVIDPTLPVKAINPIEDAATPKPFACLSTPDADSDDDDRSDDFDLRFATFHGSFVPNALSNGIDLARDRVVLAIDDQIAVIEPGSFVCRSRNRCRFTDRTASLVRGVRLERKKNGRWTFTIATNHRPWSPHLLTLRIGANWGGLDYVNDRYVAVLPLVLDAAHRVTTTIGSGGGSVQATDGTGVFVSLVVPPGALTADTPIVATPLASSPLAGADASIHPGVNFEPDGLVFAQPATLTFDFSQTTAAIGEHQAIYLLTSPLTKLPLYRTVDRSLRTITAEVFHFSTYDLSKATSAFEDLKAWADEILNANGATSFSALQSLAALAFDQMALGCTSNCIDLADLANTLSADISTLVASACPADVAKPTEDALGRWLKLEALALGMGVSTADITPCERSILDALVTKVATEGLAHPSDAAVDSLDKLEHTAIALGFGTVASRARGKKHDVLQAVIDLAGTTAAGDPSVTNLKRMIGLKAKAQAFVFADLERRVLEQSVAAARTAISRLQTACNANPEAPTTGVATELARTWVTFVNLDPTVAPTLSSDLQAAIDNCGGGMTVKVLSNSLVGGALIACYNGSATDEGSLTPVPADSALPVRFGAPCGSASLFMAAPNVLELDGAHQGWWGGVLRFVLELKFSRPGNLTWTVNKLGSGTYSTYGSTSFYLSPPDWQSTIASIHTSQPVTISGPVTLQLMVVAIVYGDAQGEVMKLRFTPTP